MQCPKCKQENSEQVQYCTRCHNPMWYKCPACAHVQRQGGTCNECGVDFQKYAMARVFGLQSVARARRAEAKGRAELIKQILLFPVTGGLSLLSYWRRRLRGEE